MIVALGGLSLTMLAIRFGIIAFVDGWREALVDLGGTVAFLALVVGAAVFWLWVGVVLA